MRRRATSSFGSDTSLGASAAQRSRPPASKCRQREWKGIAAGLAKRLRVTSSVACTAASRPFGLSENQLDRPSSTYLSTCSARSRMATGVRRYCRSPGSMDAILVILSAAKDLADRSTILLQARGPSLRSGRLERRSLVETPSLGLGEIGGELDLREVAGGLLGIHLDLRVGRDQILGNRHLLDNL